MITLNCAAKLREAVKYFEKEPLRLSMDNWVCIDHDQDKIYIIIQKFHPAEQLLV